MDVFSEVTVAFSASDFYVTEGESNAVITVNTTNPTETGFNVTVVIVMGTATCEWLMYVFVLN